eukprot:188282-Chlamydomonas_euryale.AAC.2
MLRHSAANTRRGGISAAASAASASSRGPFTPSTSTPGAPTFGAAVAAARAVAANSARRAFAKSAGEPVEACAVWTGTLCGRGERDRESQHGMDSREGWHARRRVTEWLGEGTTTGNGTECGQACRCERAKALRRTIKPTGPPPGRPLPFSREARRWIPAGGGGSRLAPQGSSVAVPTGRCSGCGGSS